MYEIKASTKDLEQFKNLHVDKKAVIVGSGSSNFEQETQDFFKIANKNDYLYFVNNYGIKLETEHKFFETDYLIINDKQQYYLSPDYFDGFNPKICKITGNHELKHKTNMTYVKFKPENVLINLLSQLPFKISGSKTCFHLKPFKILFIALSEPSPSRPALT